MSFKLDLHVHTQSFGRTFMTDQQLRRAFKARGLAGAAVTNFFNITHALWLKEKLPEFIIIAGQEIWTQSGHVIGLGLGDKIPDFLGVEETIRRIHGQGGLAVAVHPYLHLGVGGKAHALPFDAVEVYNAAIGRAGIYNYLARRLARRMKAGITASSDTTDPGFLGQGCTEVLADSPEGVLAAIREGKVVLHRRPLPLPVKFIIKNFLGIRDLEPCPLHATLCLVCGKSMRVRVFKAAVCCLDCGREEFSRVSCCNGHHFCQACSAARIHQRDDFARYDREAGQREEAGI